MTELPRLLVVSHVKPFPRSSGQQQRVFYTLQSARKAFHVTFATFVPEKDIENTRKKLLQVCDTAMVFPSLYHRSVMAKVWHKVLSHYYALRTGLKPSNYFISQLEFSPERMEALFASRRFDCVLYEYWHAVQSVDVFQKKGTPCVLDMHNVLWQTYRLFLDKKPWMPGWWKRGVMNDYVMQEEQAWRKFDGVVAINREDQRYVNDKIPNTTEVFYAPMGTDLNLFPYSWRPVLPRRVAYYGGLGSPHNQRDALACYREIMPGIWKEFPETELWLVGSNPPPSLRALSADPRVKLTGFVENVQPVLSTMAAVLCPWTGTYGFRSRLIEVMALGVPLVASPDAVYGMELEDGKGLLLAPDAETMLDGVLRLLKSDVFATEQSHLAREQVKRLYSLETTYDRLTHELNDWLQKRKQGEG